MKKELDMKSLVIGALLGAVIVLSVAAAANPPRPTVWQYMTVSGQVLGADSRLDQAINDGIAAGWEFVSASQASDMWGFAVLRREIR